MARKPQLGLDNVLVLLEQQASCDKYMKAVPDAGMLSSVRASSAHTLPSLQVRGQTGPAQATLSLLRTGEMCLTWKSTPAWPPSTHASPACLDPAHSRPAQRHSRLQLHACRLRVVRQSATRGPGAGPGLAARDEPVGGFGPHAAPGRQRPQHRCWLPPPPAGMLKSCPTLVEYLLIRNVRSVHIVQYLIRSWTNVRLRCI